MGLERVFSINDARTTGVHMRANDAGPSSQYPQNQLKRGRDLNGRASAIKLPGENTGPICGLGNNFGYDTKSSSNNTKINKRDFIKIKSLCVANGSIGKHEKSEESPHNGRKYLQVAYLGRVIPNYEMTSVPVSSGQRT